MRLQSSSLSYPDNRKGANAAPFLFPAECDANRRDYFESNIFSTCAASGIGATAP
ncbi:hypothetical protein CAter282_3195 [Collimonas arenae]|uniref:Uncharacterized protein n=1 Tax=Collimonas arenae TaxID=279058 RepID=A0A127QLG1_9BURK|nr:hypothetical protein CAter282_3195 [Collimonas arenae]